MSTLRANTTPRLWILGKEGFMGTGGRSGIQVRLPVSFSGSVQNLSHLLDDFVVTSSNPF
jgi:hypothetical protein